MVNLERMLYRVGSHLWTPLLMVGTVGLGLFAFSNYDKDNVNIQDYTSIALAVGGFGLGLLAYGVSNGKDDDDTHA